MTLTSRDFIEPGEMFYKPYLIPHEITGPFDIGGIPIVPFEQDHGISTTLGLRSAEPLAVELMVAWPAAP